MQKTVLCVLVLLSILSSTNCSTVKADDFTSTPSIGYELLENNTYIHMWNTIDNYYFDKADGVHLSNHYLRSMQWSQHILTFGYWTPNEENFSDDFGEWHELYRMDQTTDYNEQFTGVTDEYVDFTLGHHLDFSVMTGGTFPDPLVENHYSFLLTLQYHLGVADTSLSIICTATCLGGDGKRPSLNFAFGWIISNISIANDETDNYIRFATLDEQTLRYDLHGLDISERYTEFKNAFWLERGPYYIYKSWLETQPYILTVQSVEDQYNAIVTIYTVMGNIGDGEEGTTQFNWIDAGGTVTDGGGGGGGGGPPATNNVTNYGPYLVVGILFITVLYLLSSAAVKTTHHKKQRRRIKKKTHRKRSRSNIRWL